MKDGLIELSSHAKLIDIIGNKLVREKLFTIRCSLFVFIQ